MLQNLFTVALVLLAALAVYAVFFVAPTLAWAMLVRQPRRDRAKCSGKCCRGPEAARLMREVV